MLIIGHRGSRGTSPENTLVSLREAIRVDADMIEFDVRLTRDNVPVLAHDLRLVGSRRRDFAFVKRYSLAQLKEITAKNEFPIITLEEALENCFGMIYLDIEIKEVSAVTPTLKVIKKFAHQTSDWDNVLLSSFKPLALLSIRRQVPHASLALLHYRNPLLFIGWHRVLRLSAVGFHRLYIHTVALEAAKHFGLFTYAYTVNKRETTQQLIEQGIDGIVTDFPERMLRETNLRRK